MRYVRVFFYRNSYSYNFRFVFRTNKACPLYQNSGGSNAPMNVAMTEEQEEDIEKQLNTDDEDLVNVDGTKVKLSGKLLKVKHGEKSLIIII